MTTLQLNEALFRELNIIVSDEDMMKEAIKALRRIVMKRKKITPNSDEEGNKAGLPESIKRMRGIIAFSQDEIDSDERLSYFHSK